jgi:uncharacterized protein YjbI with pentapeptide repeats
LRGERTLLSRLENWTTVFLAWWIVPFTILVFWGRYLPRHHWFGTGLHIALLIISICCAMLLHRHAVRTLRRDRAAFRWRKPWLDRRTYQAAVALGFGVLFALVSLGAIEGDVRRRGPYYVDVLPDVATWMPYAFDRVGYRSFAYLREADVSTKPNNWTGLATRPEEDLEISELLEKARAELAQVKSAPLKDANLRYADAVSAFLAKASLIGANLQGAILSGANLQEADLSGAILQKANLIGANLQGANLGGAKLQGADLSSANLQGVNLALAKLQGAQLFLANLQGAKLFFAKLQGAYLRSAKLQGADLRSANLQGADLSLAKFQGANLRGADLEEANLGGANLSGANLTKAKELTQKQLDQACGDEETKLPEGLTIATCRE